MRMKNGDAVPAALAAALENDAYAAYVFAKMRPSCQQRYSLQIADTKNDTGLQSRLQSILKEIHRYGQRHGIEK